MSGLSGKRVLVTGASGLAFALPASTFTAGSGNDAYLTVNDLAGIDSSINSLLDTVSNGAAPNDNFNSGSLNNTLWSTSTSTAGSSASSTVGVVGNQLQISHTDTDATLAPGLWSSGTLRTQLPYDMTGKTTTVQLVQAANGGAALPPPAAGGRNVHPDQLHRRDALGRVSIAGGYIGAVTNATDPSAVKSIPYNAAAMQYLRIRQSGGSWYFEYSADGNTWNLLTSATDAGTVSVERRSLADRGVGCQARSRTRPSSTTSRPADAGRAQRMAPTGGAIRTPASVTGRTTTARGSADSEARAVVVLGRLVATIDAARCERLATGAGVRRCGSAMCPVVRRQAQEIPQCRQ